MGARKERKLRKLEKMRDYMLKAVECVARVWDKQCRDVDIFTKEDFCAVLDTGNKTGNVYFHNQLKSVPQEAAVIRESGYTLNNLLLEAAFRRIEAWEMEEKAEENLSRFDPGEHIVLVKWLIDDWHTREIKAVG